MRPAAALLLLFAQLLAAQAPTTRKKTVKPPPADIEGLSFPIVKLTVEGNRHLSADAILQFTGLKLGDIATKEAFDAGRVKLADSGFFDSVGYEFKPVSGTKPGYAAKFMVTEVDPLYKIQFAGFPASNDELTAYMKTRDPLFTGYGPATEQVVKRWSAFLEAWTAAKNQPKKVIGKLLPGPDNSFFVQFQPDEPLAAVARIEFAGNEAIDETTLQNTLGAVAYGLPFTEQNFRELLDNQLRPAYEAKGYMRVKFDNITSAPAPLPVKGLIVHMTVTEGPVYKLGKIRVTGVKSDDDDALIQLTGLKTGETANFDLANKGLDKVKQAERRQGFYRVAGDVDRKIDDTAKKVDVTFKLTAGDRYQFGVLTIKGLDINGEDAVRKQWGKKEGDAFNPEYPDHFLNEVRNEGLFDYLGATKAEIAASDDTHIVNVTLVFNADPDALKKKRQRDF